MIQPPQLEEEEDLSIDLGDEPALVEVEAMIESIKTRLQTDPSIVVETIHDWLAEEKEFSLK